VSEEGSPNPEDYMDREDIGAGSGSLTLPVAYFRTGDRFANAVEVSFRSTKRRKAHASLLPGSYLVSERHVIRRINLVP
jgi:precorrin-6B methylase 2